MADKLAGPGDNAVDPTDAIKQLDADLIPLEAEAAAVKGKIRKARREFKAITGIPLVDFDSARRLANIEDDEERATKLHDLSACFAALAPGQQLDWISATEKQDESPTKH